MSDPLSRPQVLAWPTSRLWTILSTLILQVAVLISTKPTSFTHAGLHQFRHALRSHHFAILAAALVLIACVCGYLVSQIVVLKAPVYNASGRHVLSTRRPPNFIAQNPNSRSLLEFRSYLEGVLDGDYTDSLAKAIAIRQWVRRQQSQDAGMWLVRARRNGENPHRLLEDQRRGVPGACRRFSYIFLGALLSAGFDARIVSFTNSLSRRHVESHVDVEVWIDELHQWVLFDPTCDAVVLVDGRPASAVELHEAVADGELESITFERNGSSLEPHPKVEVYARHCRHLFVAMSNAVFDGYGVRLLGSKSISFLHYSREAQYPALRKQLLLGISANGLLLSVVFWAWTFLSMTPE